MQVKIMVGERIRLERKRANMSLEELAQRTGISKAYLSQLEVGEKENLTVNKLLLIAEALGVPSTHLLPDGVMPPILSPGAALREDEQSHLLNLLMTQSRGVRGYLADAPVTERVRWLLLVLHHQLAISPDRLRKIVHTTKGVMSKVLDREQEGLGRELWAPYLHQATGLWERFFLIGLLPTDKREKSAGPSDLH